MSIVSYFGSLWCSLEEERHLTLVEKDLASFSKEISVNRVLIFPPLSSRFRFLIHKVVERWPKLKSCSIGSEPNRRTVVYFEEIAHIHKAQQSMNSSKLETEQAPECSPRGRGRGRGVRGRGQNQRDSPRNSPTTSRRPAQALYTPGAFSKHRQNTDSQAREAASPVEFPGNIRTKNTVPKSFIKTEPLNEQSETSKSQQVDKSNARSEHDCESGLENNGNKRNSLLEDEKSLEYTFNKSYVSSPTSSSVENGLMDRKEKNNSSSPTDITSKRIDHVDVTDVVVSESQPDCTDSNCGNVTNSLQSRDSVGQSIHFDCSLSTVNSNVDNEIMLEKCEKREKVCTKSEDTLLDDTRETIQTNYHTKLNCGETSKKAIQVEVPTMNELVTSSSESSDYKIFPNKSCGSKKTMNESKERGNASKEGVEERKNVIGDEKQLAETKIDDTVDSVTEHLRTNTECMADRESFANIHDNKTTVEDRVEVSGCVKSVSDMSDITEKEMSGSSPALSDLSNEVDKITLGKNERMVFSESKENDEAQSKSIKQHNRTNLSDKDDKIALGNNDSLVDNESEGNVEAQRESKRKHNKKNLSDKDNKITLENNENVVNSECEEKIETQSEEKWQCKPEDLNNEEDKIVRGNNESIESTGKKGKVEAKSTSNDDDKIHVTAGSNESMVDSENKKQPQVQSHSQSKSKRQSKKEEKAKKKEEKLKKKQVKTKSEKTVKKSESEEKRSAKEGEVCELGNKEKNNKEVKNQQGKEKLIGSEEKTTAKGGEVLDSGKRGKSNKEVKIQHEKEKQSNSIAVDQVLKIVRESKDTLLKVSVPEGRSSNHEDSGNEDSAEEDWEKTWNDDGERLDEDMLAELNEQIGTNNVQVVKPQFDYLSFKPNDITLENGVFDHVVELYDFSPEFKNHDLINALSNFQQQGFEIQWVDDTHALAVFSNHRTAQQAIEQCSNPMLKLRPLYEGTQKSKLEAKRNVDVLQPYKERPKTTKLIANRLVAGALGMRSKMSKEERQLEREKIKAERERKLNKEKQKKDLWESDDL